MKKLFPYLFLLLALTACDTNMSNQEGTILARVHDSYLFAIDLENVIPENTSPHDSIVFVKNFVSNWVQTKLMAHQAQKNLTDDQLDFSQQLEDYRNSLIIYSYERELINQNLDTIVSESEIENYYHTHLGDFELKENIAKVLYAIFEDDPELETEFEQTFNQPDSLLLDTLESYCEIHAYSYFLDTANWIIFSELQEIIPIEDYSRDSFLKGQRFFTIARNNNIYMLKFVDFKIKDDTSPLAFKHDDIRNIIVNKRKMVLVKKVRNDIYNKALQNDEFEIYYNE